MFKSVVFLSIVEFASVAYSPVEIGEHLGADPVGGLLFVVETVFEHLGDFLKHIATTCFHHFLELVETRVLREAIREEIDLVQLQGRSVIAQEPFIERDSAAV